MEKKRKKEYKKMTKNFSLYDKLKVNANLIEMSAEFKQKLVKTLSVLNKYQSEHIAYIIIHHAMMTQGENCLMTNNNVKVKLPYGIKIGAGGKGMGICIDNFPDILQKVIGAYCQI